MAEVAEIGAQHPFGLNPLRRNPIARRDDAPRRRESGCSGNELFVGESADLSPGSHERQESRERQETRQEKRQDGGRDADARDAEDRHPDGSDKGSQGIKAAFRKHSIAILICGGLIALGVIAGIAWYLHARHFESTDDAFIDGRPVLVIPQVTGSIISVNVTDNQIVKTGDLLATIDRENYKAAVDQADAQIRQNEATEKISMPRSPPRKPRSIRPPSR